MTANDPVFTVAALRAGYLGGTLDPAGVLALARQRIGRDSDNPVWLHVASETYLAGELQRLAALDPQTHPLWGIPFAVKDNIDVAGMPTTAACPAFAYAARADAAVVAALRAAGAVVLGKTNLDQFATGLVGTRSPYGEVRNACLPEYISGGSSSGSAVAVARGHVAFALGTDTAGSGRVPAALNGLVGVKPSRGLVSTRGVVPACRSLDCVSLFARDLADVAAVFPLMRAYDALDPWARPFTLDATLPPVPVIGVPQAGQLAFFGDDEARALFSATVTSLRERGVETREIDFRPFMDAACLLYEGPWLAERWLSVQPLPGTQPEALLPVTRAIIGGGEHLKTPDAFAAMYRLQALRREIEPLLAGITAIMTPTIGTPFTRAQIAEEPVRRNSELGYYTNFMNLLDLAALAMPAGQFGNGLPHGVTVFADHGADLKLQALARRLFPETAGGGSVPDDVTRLDILVCGAHMSGLPLNTQLTERGALFRETVRTAPLYRFWALPGGPPFRPAMLRVAPGQEGGRIEAEIWSLPAARWGDFVQLIPSPLGIGTVVLEDSRTVKGFIGEGFAAAGAEDITALGSWRAFLARR
ncbi:MAG: allophanate hydrolase [Pseudomonadota bacterium]